jgi:hypothetical protein
MKDPKSDVDTRIYERPHQHEVDQSESLRRAIGFQHLKIQDCIRALEENLNVLNQTELEQLRNLLDNFIQNIAPGEPVSSDDQKENTAEPNNFPDHVGVPSSGRVGNFNTPPPLIFYSTENIKCPHCEREIKVKVHLEK